jgi:hypothetical protein
VALFHSGEDYEPVPCPGDRGTRGICRRSDQRGQIFTSGADGNPELRLSRANTGSRTRSSVRKDRRVLPDERLDGHGRGAR